MQRSLNNAQNTTVSLANERVAIIIGQDNTIYGTSMVSNAN